MKKAQAFDVFQLMIAAVIAVAILGILLSIIGQIFIPSQRPIQVIQEKLTDAYQYQGALFTSATKATFQKDDSIPASIFKKNAGGRVPSVVCAEFIDPTDASQSQLASCGTDQILVKSTFDATVATCCDQSGCYIYVGASPSIVTAGSCPTTLVTS